MSEGLRKLHVSAFRHHEDEGSCTRKAFGSLPSAVFFPWSPTFTFHTLTKSRINRNDYKNKEQLQAMKNCTMNESTTHKDDKTRLVLRATMNYHHHGPVVASFVSPSTSTTHTNKNMFTLRDIVIPAYQTQETTSSLTAAMEIIEQAYGIALSTLRDGSEDDDSL